MELSPKDLIITTWCSEKKSSWSMAEDNGIRVIHLPTGTVVTCENERSQHRNKAKALKELEEKLQDHPDLDGTDY